jgi:YVTN family beta-propeller protein
MGYNLGIDLGTTFVAAAVARPGQVEMVTLGDSSVVIPAAVYLRDDGELVAGNVANRRAVSNPDRVVREFKRRLGDPTPVMLAGKPYSITTLLAVLLRDLVDKTAELEGERPGSVVLTHPANWGPFRRGLFEEVPAQAGLTDVRLVTEPEAAAAHYAASRRLSDNEIVAVYDLGGGTFDATVLAKRADRVDILGIPEGIERLGGVDFDEAVLSYVNVQSGGLLSELDLSDPKVTVAMARLRQDCVQAKEALSMDIETTIPVFLPGRHLEVTLSRSNFEDMIRAPVESTIGVLERTLRSAGLEAGELSSVLLVGGSSRIPLVARMVTEQLGCPTVVDTHPKYAVALGAATLTGQITPRDAGTPAKSPAKPAGRSVGKSAGKSAGAAGAVAAGAAAAGAAAAAAGAGGAAVAASADGAAPKRSGWRLGKRGSSRPADLVPAAAPINADEATTVAAPLPSFGRPRASAPGRSGASGVSGGPVAPVRPGTPGGPAEPGTPAWPGPGGQPGPIGPGPGGNRPVAPTMPAGPGGPAGQGGPAGPVGPGRGGRPAGANGAGAGPAAGSRPAGPAVSPGARPAGPNGFGGAGGPGGPNGRGGAPVGGRGRPDHQPGWSASSPAGWLEPPASRPSRTDRFGKSGRAVLIGALVLVLIGAAVIFWWPASNQPPAAGPNAPAAAGPQQPPANPAAPAVAAALAVPTVLSQIPIGKTPGFVALTPDGRKAYVSNVQAATISVLDTTTNQIAATIPVPAGPPRYVMFTPDGSRAYVSIYNDALTIAALAVVDTASNQIVHVIPMRARPFVGSVTKDGKQVWVPNHDSGTVSVVDTATNTLVREFQVARNPHWVEFSPDGSRAYLANHESNLVSVVDTKTFAVLAQIPVGRSPHSVAVHPTRPLLADCDYDGNSVTFTDTNSNKVIGSVPVGKFPQDATWSADGRVLYAVNDGDNTVSVINPDTRQVTATLPTGGSPTSLAVTPDGRHGYVTNLDSGTLTYLELGK